jgi:hypothetical protein
MRWGGARSRPDRALVGWGRGLVGWHRALVGWHRAPVGLASRASRAGIATLPPDDTLRVGRSVPPRGKVAAPDVITAGLVATQRDLAAGRHAESRPQRAAKGQSGHQPGGDHR